jgi:hypothetical protein
MRSENSLGKRFNMKIKVCMLGSWNNFLFF